MSYHDKNVWLFKALIILTLGMAACTVMEFNRKALLKGYMQDTQPIQMRLKFNAFLIEESPKWIKAIVELPKKGVSKEVYFSKKQVKIKRLTVQSVELFVLVRLAKLDGLA